MQITVLGASGRVGRIVVQQLLQQNHTVIAFVHSQNPFKEDKNLRIVTGDTSDAAAVAAAVRGSDAVISCLGSWGTPTKDILTKAMKTLLPILEQSGPKRLISLTGAAAFLPDEKTSTLDNANRLFLKTLQPKILADGEAHLRLLHASKLDWTALRSPVMTGKNSATYRLSTKLPGPWVTVPRIAVATAIVSQLTDHTYIGQAPALYPR